MSASVYGRPVYKSYGTPKPRIEFESLGQEHYSQVYYLMLTSFVREEPLAMCLGVTHEAVTPMHDLITKAIYWKVSFVAVDRSTKRVVGVRLSSLLFHHDPKERTPESYPRCYQEIQGFLGAATAGLFCLLPSAHVVLKFEALAVDAAFRRLGIARRLVEMSVELGRAQRCQFAVSVATAAASQKLFAARGFRTLREISYGDYVGAGGGRPFAGMPKAEPKAQLVCLSLGEL